MRKTFKKSLALVLAMLMMLSIGQLGFAAGNPCSHVYTSVTQWLWSDDATTCGAQVKCDDCGEPAILNASVSDYSSTAPTCTVDGKEVKIATVTLTNTSKSDIKEITIPKIGHNFTGEIKSNGDGTHSWKCVNTGCTALGYMDADNKPVVGSKACASTGTNVATCTTKAKCDVCGAEYGQTSAHHMTATPAKANTCVAAGNIAYWYCDECDTYFYDAEGAQKIEITASSDPRVIPALGGAHVEEEEYSFFSNSGGEYDCTAGGYKVKLCARCGAQLMNTKINVPGAGHVQADDWKYIGKNGADFDCTVGGERVRYCQNCGKEIGNRETVAKKDHSYIRYAQVNATCTEPGMTAYTACSVCGKRTTQPTVIPPDGHTIVAVAKQNATCSQTGNVAYWKCTKCGMVFRDKNGTEAVYDIMDVDEDGNEYVVLSAVDQMSTPKADHKFTREVKAKDPDCTNDGTREVFKCSVCSQRAVKFNYELDGDEAEKYYNSLSGAYFVDIANLNDAKLPKLGHNWVKDYQGVNYVAPTCSSEGQCNAFCSECLIPTVLTLDKLPHQSKRMIKAVEPTCERGKYEIHECKVCGQTYELDLYNPDLPDSVDQSKIKPIGHNFSGFVSQIQEATCTQVGIRGRACLNGCGKYLDGVESPMLPHSLSSVKVEPDGHTPGYTGKKCSMCGQVFDKVEIPPVSVDHLDKSPVDGKCDICGFIMCDHICHDTNFFKQIVWFVAKLWYQFLGINQVCKCGALHYTKSGDINVPA